MRLIRYLNLFEKITGVRTKNCFFYNNGIIYAVPKQFVSKAIGEGGNNVRKMVSITKKKIKIVIIPDDQIKTENFIQDIVAPATFNNLEVTEKELIIFANKQSKAALIGRNKTRLIELSKIVEEFFGKELKIV